MTKSTFRVALNIAVVVSLVAASAGAAADAPIIVRGGVDANLLRGGLSSGMLQGGLNASVLRGGLNASVLQGGINASVLRGRVNSRTLFLMPQQGKVDPLTRMTVLELMQRRKPQADGISIHSIDLLRQQPVSAPFPTFATPPPIPVGELAPILDQRQMQEEVALFDRNFRKSLNQIDSDLAEANQDADKNFAELERLTRDKIAQFDIDDQDEIVKQNHQRMSQLLAEQSPPDKQELDRVFGKLQNENDQAYENFKEKRPDRDVWVAQAKAKLATMSVHAQERMAQFSREAAARRAMQAPNPDGDEIGIPWDEWYSNFANAVKQPLIEALRKHGDAAGTNTVLVTVWSDGLLDVQTQRSDNTEFDAAVLEAYKSLVFTPVLQFPQGSKRVSVSFYTDHRHLEQGKIFDVDLHKITGDIERR